MNAAQVPSPVVPWDGCLHQPSTHSKSLVQPPPSATRGDVNESQPGTPERWLVMFNVAQSEPRSERKQASTLSDS